MDYFSFKVMDDVRKILSFWYFFYKEMVVYYSGDIVVFVVELDFESLYYQYLVFRVLGIFEIGRVKYDNSEDDDEVDEDEEMDEDVNWDDVLYKIGGLGGDLG